MSIVKDNTTNNEIEDTKEKTDTKKENKELDKELDKELEELTSRIESFGKDIWKPADLSQDYVTQKHHIMTLREWFNKDILIKDIVHNAAPQDGKSRYKNSALGICCRIFPVEKNAIKKGNIHYKALDDSNKNIFCLNDFTVNTDGNRLAYYSSIGVKNRRQILAQIKDHKFITKSVVSPAKVMENYKRSKFIMSPLGNGVDCHRHIEALVSKAIPLIPTGCDYIYYKYRNMPVIYVSDFSKITEKWLLEEREKMMDKTYDFSLMFYDSYDPQTVAIMNAQADYWIKRICMIPYRW